MPNKFITNLRHLETFPEEQVDFREGVLADVPRMLAMVSLATLSGGLQRKPLNFYATMLAHEGGDRFAKKVVESASDMPVFHDAIEDGMLENENLWIGGKRLNPMELSGSVIAQKEVSVVDENGRILIDNGIIVEAITKPDFKHELPAYYAAGIAVANSMATNGEVVFSIETAETYAERQTRIERWVQGKLEHDEEVHQSVFKHYTYKSEPINSRRSDFGKSKTVPAIIYTDSKSTIDLTTSN